MKRKIYLCPKCGRAMEFSPLSEYTFYCVDCDEDFYSFERNLIQKNTLLSLEQKYVFINTIYYKNIILCIF